MYLYKMVSGIQLEEVEGKLEGLDTVMCVYIYKSFS